MATVTLRQGRYKGIHTDDVNKFLGIPYSRPFSKRFQLPQPPLDSDREYSAEEWAANCPQPPSRLAAIVGDLPTATKYDERHCGVLSIYVSSTASQKTRPVIVWMHGGAFMTGGSQLPHYDGTALARDAGAVVVCISYRLGALGFLYEASRSLDDDTPDLPAGAADVIAALRWIQLNISSFGGDPENVTIFGQSAGAYLCQCMFDLAPNLFARAVLQSSPASITITPEQAAQVRQDFEQALPPGLTPDIVDLPGFLRAQGQASMANKYMQAQWGPTTTKIPGFQAKCRDKDVLVGWTETDGKIFEAVLGWTDQDGKSPTDHTFRLPSQKLADKLKSDGHRVTTFEICWAPEAYAHGPTHCCDLPLVFGDEEAWKEAPLVQAGRWEDFEMRGQRWRAALGRFAHDGVKPSNDDFVRVW